MTWVNLSVAVGCRFRSALCKCTHSYKLVGYFKKEPLQQKFWLKIKSVFHSHLDERWAQPMPEARCGGGFSQGKRCNGTDHDCKPGT